MARGRPVVAQVQTGNISVKAVDDQGAVMPGASVTISSAVLPRPIDGTTDVSGVFQVPGLTPATYTIKIALQGFQTLIREDIIVRQGQTVTIDVAMKVGALSEEVTVKGETPVVDTKSATSTTTSTRRCSTRPRAARTSGASSNTRRRASSSTRRTSAATRAGCSAA